ncbi:hypothetical protein CsatB_014960 [Cannabis sativa]
MSQSTQSSPPTFSRTPPKLLLKSLANLSLEVSSKHQSIPHGCLAMRALGSVLYRGQCLVIYLKVEVEPTESCAMVPLVVVPLFLVSLLLLSQSTQQHSFRSVFYCCLYIGYRTSLCQNSSPDISNSIRWRKIRSKMLMLMKTFKCETTGPKLMKLPNQTNRAMRMRTMTKLLFISFSHSKEELKYRTKNPIL